MRVIVVKKTFETNKVVSLELASPSGKKLPVFTPGSHIDVQLAESITRQYSLMQVPENNKHWMISVLKEENSRGGSSAVHSTIKEGDLLTISEPRNFFTLMERAAETLLFAGGIGITPLLCMAEALNKKKLPFTLNYSSRSHEDIAFRSRIENSSWSSHANLYFDEDTSSTLDLNSSIGQPDAKKHLYVCGPQGYIEWILSKASELGWQDENLHREYFSNTETAVSTDSFLLRIASDGKELVVPSDKTVAEVLLDAGYEVALSCEQGVCGSCLTGILEGTPQHNDMFLTNKEKEENSCFTPCCSRAISTLLVVDM